jgi:hypothetical protein
VAVTAALAQWVHIPTRRADAGAALAKSDQEGGCRRRMPVHDGAMGNREGGECATATGGGGVARGGGGRGKAEGMPLLVGLCQRWATMVRMTVAAGGTKQQPTP